MKDAIYARVSSSGQSLAGQEADLDRWAQLHDCEPQWYIDVATGRTMDRPRWRQLEQDYRSGAIRQIVVWRLDRLGRTARHLLALFDDLNRCRVNLVSLREGIDLATPAGRMIAGVIASMAQYENEVRSERQRSGIEAAKEEYRRGIRATNPYPGRAGRPVERKADPQEARRLKRLGLSSAQIAGAIGVTRSTVYEYLKIAETTSASDPDV